MTEKLLAIKFVQYCNDTQHVTQYMLLGVHIGAFKEWSKQSIKKVYCNANFQIWCFIFSHEADFHSLQGMLIGDTRL